MKKIKSVESKEPRSYKFYLFIAVFLIALLIIISSISAGYFYSQNLVKEQAQISQDEISERIFFDTALINKALDMYDTSLNNRVETDFQYFMEEYEKSGGNPDLMDISSVSEKIGDDGVTLYIINESYVITHATNPDSVGLDFSIYSPYYTQYLDDIRKSQGFFPERVVAESETGLQKKFGYMPTPDNKYILEISLYDEDFTNARKELKFSEKIEEIAEMSPYVKGVRIFNTMKNPVGKTDYNPGPEYLSLLNEILASESSRDVTDPETGETLRYLYVPLKNDFYGSDNSLIVELSLDQGPLEKMYSGIFIQYLLICIFSIGLCTGSAILISHHFSDEIEGIVRDVAIISNGNLEHKIRYSKAKEFKNLEESINQMVKKIRENIEKYKESQAVLKIERDRAQTYFDLAEVIFIASEKDGTIKDINEKALEILEYSKKEATDKNFFDLLLKDNNSERVKNLFNESLKFRNFRPLYFSCRIQTKSGRIRDVSLSAVILKDAAGGEVKGLLITGTDITEELETKKALELSLEQKSALLSEVHHRVKNNLQIITSLFELKSSGTKDKTLMKFLNESKSRINTMAIVHEIMYSTDNYTRVNLSDYTRDIVAETFSSHKPKKKINVSYDLDDVFYDLDHSIPYGLLLNELVANSIIHAFKEEDGGSISISLKIQDEKIILTYKDNGCGIPSDEELKEKGTIGFYLISGLVGQLSGKMQILREGGTTFIIELELQGEKS
ncbi:MAG: PAS domain S-box protein [Methanomicrobiaceae archaeon]|nr:PAS domain S-box protein [Methanomicrobiaceae archaeon]